MSRRLQTKSLTYEIYQIFFIYIQDSMDKAIKLTAQTEFP